MHSLLAVRRIASLAAAYAVGIAKNHPFIDGNKRVSNVVTFMFLALNGRALQAEAAEQVRVWLLPMAR